MKESRLDSSGIFKILGVVYALFGVFALLGSVFLWGQGFILNPPEGVDLAFPVADTLINAPASILTGIGFWRMRKWGFALAWFTAGFYLYASVEIFVHALQEGILTSALEITIPQVAAVLVALVTMVVTWKNREKFI
ncbi:MAG: hypothetical protein ABFS17_00375 [Chloroflexota bacterium]